MQLASVESGNSRPPSSPPLGESAHPTREIPSSDYYLGPNAGGYLPFDNLQTISHYIMPNFATLDWDAVPKREALANYRRLEDDEDAIYDDLMIYIHVPYCRSFCHYCNFNRSHYPRQKVERLERYTDYLIREIDFYLRLPYVRSRNLTAVYIGGGSPSTLPVTAVHRLYDHLEKVIPNYKDLEITFTGEPRTLQNLELLQALKDHKVSRITFGVESFNEQLRRSIGRGDRLEDTRAVLENMDKVGYTGDRDMDIMFDLPGQTLEGFMEELDIMIRDYRPTELDAYGTIYLPYRPLHRLIINGKVPQPGNIWQLLRMREYLYDFLLANGFHNNIAETYSSNTERTRYQTAHCARQNILGIGCAARSNLKDMVAINPSTVEDYFRNIDDNGAATTNLQSIGRSGVLDRIMVMWPRYRELTKDLLESFSDTSSYPTHKRTLRKHIEAGCVEDHGDRWKTNKLGILWSCNLQTDYMWPSVNRWGRILVQVLKERPKHFGRKQRFRSNMYTRIIEKYVDKYPKLMK
ncbi:MAG: radical SAM protein [bacterium]|nr:radical SAM protein [bacterium]